MAGAVETINGKQMKTCAKCGKLLEVTKNFYKKNNGEYTDLCKKCLTMHIDNFKEETFLWILKDMDYPYIPSEWNTIRDKEYAKKGPEGMDGMSVFGKYLSKMKLVQYKGKTWADSEQLIARMESKKTEQDAERQQYENELKEQFEAGEISEAQYQTLVSTATQNKDYKESIMNVPVPPVVESAISFFEEDPLDDVELTEEERRTLRMKWGSLYKPSEWIELEQSYTDMMKSFDIQDADTINTLKMLCKTNLKANQAIDMGDIEGYQKLSKVYNDLRKSAKFTAAQNKEEKDEFVDCVGELVAYCEKEGGRIPKYKIETPRDIIDEVINDLKGYTRDLIYEDKSLAKQIEDHLKKIEIANQMKEDKELAKQQGKENVEIEIQDYEDHFNSIMEQKEIDRQLLNGELE